MEDNKVENVVETNEVNDVNVEMTQEEIDNEIANEVFIEEKKAEEDAYDNLVKERDDYKNKYMYAVAECENIRKRNAQDRPKVQLAATKSAIRSVLTALDDFERAIKANESADDINAIKEGFTNIYNKLLGGLASIGVMKMNCVDADFNTDYHAAVTTVPTTEDKNNKVIDCLENGYTLNDEVIRHAKVVVGSFTKDETEETAE